MRAFVGLALSDEARASLEQLQRRLAESRADVGWVTAQHLHVTLKFLNEISDAQRLDVEAAMARVAAPQVSFSLALGALGAFPSLRAPRVLWVGVEQGAEAVVRLAEALEHEACSLSLRRDERPYSPHVTLGRLRSSRALPALLRQLRVADWHPPASWRVSALTLYQSVLTPTGPRYSILTEVPLGAAPRA
jgi:2'-5' RNA ligase